MKFITIIFLCIISTMMYAHEKHDIEKLLDAIKIVESNNSRYLTGKNGEFGPYQIKKIVIDDVNRIIGMEIYSYSDMEDETKSREICKFYILYWSNRSGNKSIESMARIWNGGPNGNKKESTKKYWKKIMEVMYGNN